MTEQSTPGIITGLAIASPFLVALLGGVGWLYRHERERRAAVEQQVSERKYQTYITLLDIFFGIMKAMRRGKPLREEELVDRMIDANKDLMLFSSDEVLGLYHAWLRNSREGLVDMEQFGELIVAIRRDMGYPRTEITADDVLRQIITDYDAAKARGDLRRQISTSGDPSSQG